MRLVKMNSTCYVVVSSQDMNGFHWLIYVFYAKNMDWQKNCQRIRLRQSLLWGFVIFCVLIFNQNIPRLPNSLLSIQFNKNQPSRPKLPPSKGHPDVNRPTTKKKHGVGFLIHSRQDLIPFFVEGNDFSRPWTCDMLIRARLESERTNISHESNRPSSDGGINWCLWWYFKKWFSHRRFEPGFRSEQWKKGFEFGSGWDVPRERKIRDFTRSTNGYSIWMVNIWVKISDSREALRKQVEKHTILLSYPLFNIQTLFSPLVKETSIACHSKCGFCFSPTSFDVAKSHRTIFDTIQVLVNFPFKWAVR